MKRLFTYLTLKILLTNFPTPDDAPVDTRDDVADGPFDFCCCDGCCDGYCGDGLGNFTSIRFVEIIFRTSICFFSTIIKKNVLAPIT